MFRKQGASCEEPNKQKRSGCDCVGSFSYAPGLLDNGRKLPRLPLARINAASFHAVKLIGLYWFPLRFH